MPPHRPFEASPIGTLTTPGIPMERMGTCGNEFEKRNPEILGRNPGTTTVAMTALLVDKGSTTFPRHPHPSHQPNR